MVGRRQSSASRPCIAGGGQTSPGGRVCMKNRQEQDGRVVSYTGSQSTDSESSTASNRKLKGAIADQTAAGKSEAAQPMAASPESSLEGVQPDSEYSFLLSDTEAIEGIDSDTIVAAVLRSQSDGNPAASISQAWAWAGGGEVPGLGSCLLTHPVALVDLSRKGPHAVAHLEVLVSRALKGADLMVHLEAHLVVLESLALLIPNLAARNVLCWVALVLTGVLLVAHLVVLVGLDLLAHLMGLEVLSAWADSPADRLVARLVARLTTHWVALVLMGVQDGHHLVVLEGLASHGGGGSMQHTVESCSQWA
ncbi:hypothetical protein WJX74_006454 [Apatococcus lobatus]|uniref:Uncharacterized protein n=1 Tax=Apatococcus lobatus TaxID=904363 RepID=A0AAW1RH87_9CHLO